MESNSQISIIVKHDDQTKKDHSPNYGKAIKPCSHCNTDFELVNGSITYVGNWYHRECWTEFAQKRGLGQVV